MPLYRDCLQRMCPCNRKSCNCEILSSYVDKCSKVLTNRTHQFSMTASFENECPNFNQFSDTSASQPNTNLNQSRTARTLDALRTDKRYELDKLQGKLIYWHDLCVIYLYNSVHTVCIIYWYKQVLRKFLISFFIVHSLIVVQWSVAMWRLLVV